MEKKITREELQREFEKIGHSKNDIQYGLKRNKNGDFVYRTYNDIVADKILNNFPFQVTFSKRTVLKSHTEYKFVW